MATLYHEPMSNTSGIYRIVCVPTSKFYIGSAVNLRNRRKCHVGTLRNGKHKNPKLQRAFNKYGEENFIFEVIEYVLIPDMLLAREQYWFQKLKPFGNRGFNIAPRAGSNLGKKHSPETVEKIRISNQGQKRVGPDPRIGSKRSPEVCAKMSADRKGKPNYANRGKVRSDEARAKIREARHRQIIDPESSARFRKTLIVISPEGIEYTIVGIRKFCKEHDLTRTCLMKVAKGEYSQHKGWKARFPD